MIQSSCQHIQERKQEEAVESENEPPLHLLRYYGPATRAERRREPHGDIEEAGDGVKSITP